MAASHRDRPWTWLLLLCALACLATPWTSAAKASDLRVAGPNVICDQGGRTIRIQAPFSRIISLYGAHTENLFALGLNCQIIGVSQHEAHPPAALRKPAFSYHDGPERFLAARPDLVLVRPMIDRGYPQLIQRLEKSGITVISLQPRTVEKMYVYWQILGMLTDREDRARRMIQAFERAGRDFAGLTRHLTRKKRVYFEAIHSKMKTFSPDAMPIFALQTAGGINIAADAQPVRGTNIAAYGKERILSHADEIDVYLAQFGTMNRTSIALIRQEPGFQALRAVREGQIYLIDEMVVSRPTFRLLNGIFKIGSILYPQIYNPGAERILKEAHGTTP